MNASGYVQILHEPIQGWLFFAHKPFYSGVNELQKN